MKRFLIVCLVLAIVAVIWCCVSTMVLNAAWTEHAFSQPFIDKFDMGIFEDSTTMLQFVNSKQYPAQLVADVGDSYRVWSITLPQSERHHAAMSITEMSADNAVPETEYKILVTQHPAQLSDPDLNPAFLANAKQAKAYCIASIISICGSVTITTYGDSAEACVAYIEQFLLETFHDLLN